MDTCNFETGEVLQVRARGEAEIVPFDAERAMRKLARYLGPDSDRWEPRFRASVIGDDATRFARLMPARLVARDLSFKPA